jgi:hypothetical protein
MKQHVAALLGFMFAGDPAPEVGGAAEVGTVEHVETLDEYVGRLHYEEIPDFDAVPAVRGKFRQAVW